MSETRCPRLSESVQNHLVNIVRLCESEREPVPLSHLDTYLSHPTVNPQGQPIPRPEGILANCTPRRLSELSAGQQIHILQCSAGEPVCLALAEQGLRPGAVAEILLVSEQSLLLRIQDTNLSVARTCAQTILVESIDGPDDADAECTLHLLPSGPA